MEICHLFSDVFMFSEQRLLDSFPDLIINKSIITEHALSSNPVNICLSSNIRKNNMFFQNTEVEEINFSMANHFRHVVLNAPL